MAGQPSARPAAALAGDKIAAIWVVIPAYNEATVIGEVVRQVRVSFPNVAVVDDCSRDETGAAAARSGAHVLRHPVNLGQGAALQTGISYALQRGADLIVTFDADGQHHVEDVFTMIDIQAREQADVVLGSRFLGSTSDMPGMRRVILRAATAFMRMTSGLDLTDAHNGLRLLTRGAAGRIRLEQNRMAHASEFVDQLKPLGLKVVEAPVRIAYTEYSLEKGQSNAASFHIMIELLAGWLSR